MSALASKLSGCLDGEKLALKILSKSSQKFYTRNCIPDWGGRVTLGDSERATDFLLNQTVWSRSAEQVHVELSVSALSSPYAQNYQKADF